MTYGLVESCQHGHVRQRVIARYTIFLLTTLLVTLALSSAQISDNPKKYWVFFKDKGPLGKTSNAWRQAAEIVSRRAQERRAMRVRMTSVIDQEDLPLYPPYLDAIARRGGQLQKQSRWLNAASFFLTREQQQHIESLPFVERVTPVIVFYRRDEAAEPQSPFPIGQSGALDYGPSFSQNDMIGATKAHALGITGSGVLVGMLDTGFRWRIHEALQSSNVLAEHDFIQNDDTTANQVGDAPEQDAHGTLTMSVLGGYKPGQLIGPAFGVQFLLAKTEYVPTETRIEEDNWVAGIEWMESQGADVVSSSLGYNIFDDGSGYRWENGDFNGRTAVTSRAAVRAARLGVVVCTAMGNEGNGDGIRGTLLAPADADSILSIGAVNFSRRLAGFSSTGPTNDGRIKPEVVAPGVRVYGALPGQSSYAFISGTSLATPLAAASAALLLSARPDLTAQQVRDALLNTADTINVSSFPTRPNNFTGWGLVNVFNALSYPTLELVGQSNRIAVFVGSPNGVFSNAVNLYYRANSDSFQAIPMKRYHSIPNRSNGTFRTDISGFSPGTMIRFYIETQDSAGNRIRIPQDNSQTFAFAFGTTTLLPPSPTPPSAPTLVSPPNGATDQPTTPTLSWTGSVGATTYRLQVSTDSLFGTTVFDDSTLTDTSRQVGPLANSTTYYWRLNAKNVSRTSPYSEIWHFTTILPTVAKLEQNYPNPFNYPNPLNPTTTIRYELPRTENVVIEIFNALGQRIRKLVDEVKPGGSYKVDWDGASDAGYSVPSGVYLYQMRIGSTFLTKKMVVLR